MPRFALPPYYHPTTVCLIDDNQSFLSSLERSLPAQWPVRSFVDPHRALAFLNQPPALAPLVDRCFAYEQRPGQNPVIHFDPGMIEQEINHIERFSRVSVAVIDYAMPALDGLALSAALTDPYLQRAMLTGVANEKHAVAAFNDRLLDRFSSKQKLSTAEAVTAFVDESRFAYFNQHASRLQSNLSLNPPGFLLVPQIATQVQALMARHALVEYYLVTDPPGLLMLNAAGRLHRLVIADSAELALQAQSAQKMGAPAAVVAALAEGRQLGWFWDSPSDYFGAEPYPWGEHLLDAAPIPDASGWYMALMVDPPMDIDFDPATRSFDAFLRTQPLRA